MKEDSSYQQYIAHQKEKTLDPVRRKKWLGEEWEPKLRFFEASFEKILNLYPHIKNKKGIGFGARTGQEVQAMKNQGFDAIGIDIVSCEPLVVEGDIHNIPFPDETFDFAFTNIYDHSLYPERFISDAYRVLKQDALFLLHLAVKIPNDDYGVTYIKDVNEVLDLLTKANFKILSHSKMKFWGGMNWEVLIQK